MFEIWDKSRIRYWDLASKIFPATGIQEVIPFLGAGVSVSNRRSSEKIPEPAYPAADVMQRIYELVGLNDAKSRLYLEYAVRVALWMEAWEQANGQPPPLDEFIRVLEQEEYPPFTSELAELFSRLAPYRSLEDTALPAIAERKLLPFAAAEFDTAQLVPMLQLLIRSTKVASPTDPLTSISSYYEAGGERSDLWQNLHRIFRNKTVPTDTHRLIASAARHHLASKPLDEYLIITTNYDCLIERALDDEQKTPYVVLWMNHADGKIYSRFANLDSGQLKRLQEINEPRYPNDFYLRRGNDLLAIVYKMHGSLAAELTKNEDGLVITDADYVTFISQSALVIPKQITSLLSDKRLLFLGYSFSDWNIRSLYETVIRRAEHARQDYAVTQGLSKFEQTYFKKKDIIVILAGLNEFTESLRQGGPPS